MLSQLATVAVAVGSIREYDGTRFRPQGKNMTIPAVYQRSPAALLGERLQQTALSGKELAECLCVRHDVVSKLLAGKVGINPELATRLGRFFGDRPEFWMTLQAEHALALFRKNGGEAAIVAEVRPRSAGARP